MTGGARAVSRLPASAAPPARATTPNSTHLARLASLASQLALLACVAAGAALLLACVAPRAAPRAPGFYALEENPAAAASASAQSWKPQGKVPSLPFMEWCVLPSSVGLSRHAACPFPARIPARGQLGSRVRTSQRVLAAQLPSAAPPAHARVPLSPTPCSNTQQRCGRCCSRPLHLDGRATTD